MIIVWSIIDRVDRFYSKLSARLLLSIALWSTRRCTVFAHFRVDYHSQGKEFEKMLLESTLFRKYNPSRVRWEKRLPRQAALNLAKEQAWHTILFGEPVGHLRKPLANSESRSQADTSMCEHTSISV